MRTGYFQHERVDAAIGPQDGGDGLSLLRAHAPFDYTDGATNNIVWDGPFAMTHNWSMRLYENRILARPLPDQSTDFEHRENRTAGDWRFIFHAGPSSTTFDVTWPSFGAGIP